MASEADHIAAANLNQRTLGHLCQDVSVHGPWVAVVAFYKALHIVEAVFANDPEIRHCTDHGSREMTLKRKTKYEHIHRQYAPLSRAATIARYLHHSGKDYHSFFDDMDAGKIESELLFFRLHELEKSAAKFFTMADRHSTIAQMRAACPRPGKRTQARKSAGRKGALTG